MYGSVQIVRLSRFEDRTSDCPSEVESFLPGIGIVLGKREEAGGW